MYMKKVNELQALYFSAIFHMLKNSHFLAEILFTL